MPGFVSLALLANAPVSHMIDFQKVFVSSPLIYSLLSVLSVASLAIWLYSFATIRFKEVIPGSLYEELKKLLALQHYAEAQSVCSKQASLLSSLIAVGLSTRHMGPEVMVDAIKSEGKRVATPLWQRLSLLSDIAMLSPMIGLLGTVIGMFYAFYDVNRSVESINTLFDGLGIAVGTTVAGLIVSILAMFFATTLKYRLIKTLSFLESKSLALTTLIQKESNAASHLPPTMSVR